MEFYCVYCKNRKKFDKYIKKNQITKKYIIDVSQMMSEEELSMDRKEDITYLKVVIFNIINKAIDKNMSVYYLPNFDIDFSISKLLNLREILGKNKFNILMFYNEFNDNDIIRREAFMNLHEFDSSNVVEDY